MLKGEGVPELKCEICGKRHATWEHRIYEKIKLTEIGVPPERLFLSIPDELESERKNDNK